MDFGIIDQLVMIWSFINYPRKYMKHKGVVRQVFMGFKKTNNSVISKILCKILIEVETSLNMLNKNVFG